MTNARRNLKSVLVSLATAEQTFSQSRPQLGKRIQDMLFNGAIAIVLIVAAVVILLPMFIVLLLSFDSREQLGALPPPGFSLHWYYRFFTSSFYLESLGISLKISVLAVSFSTVAATSAAVFLHRARFVGRDTLLAIFMAPLIVPAVVIGFSLVYLSSCFPLLIGSVMFLSTMGVYDGFLRLLAGYVLITLPYCIRTTLAGLYGIPPTFSEAALSLGANERQTFWAVTFPLARRGIIAGMIFALAMSLDDVSVSIFLVTPPHYTLPVAILSQMRANFDLTIAAVGTLFMVFSGLLVWSLDRFVGMDQLFGRGIYRSG